MLHKHHNIYTIFTLVLTLLFCLPIVAQQQSVSTNSNSATTLDKAKQPDAPSAIAERFFNGMNAGDQYGRSVSSAGDVNGDGYDDLIIGAPFYDDGVNTIAGRAYIYFGGNIINNMPDVTLTGEAVDDRFGFSVSSAGDVNGDGYSDVIVGAYVNNNFTGKSYIFFGGSTISGNINASSADVTMTGEATSNRFGWSVSSAGDVNGDGYSDVIVGAYQHNTSTGKSYVFFGGSSMSGNIATSSADVTITGETTHNRFGYSVSSTGDVNGDGYSDVIVGAYQHNNFTGKSYVFFGGSSMSGNIAAASADVTMTGETTSGDHFGISVSSAGDVNGDGYSDVIVGAYGNNSYTGKSYIYFGGSTMNSTPDVIMTGETASDSFGFSVA
ncbi:MAG: integrin alpha, partial [Melioribacteraceae bacterium]